MIVDQLRAVIADDERPARAFLRNALRKRPDVEIVGEAAEGIAAVRLIEEQRPDVAFLDLQMPGLDGIGVVRMVDRRHLPFVVFVTAYEEHAVKAFEVNAVDYLLKPVSPERLAETLSRVHERLDRTDQRAAAAAGLQRAVDAVEPATRSGYLERIPVRRRDEIAIVPVKQLATLVAQGELVHLTTIKGERHTISVPPEGSRGQTRSREVHPAGTRHAGRCRPHCAGPPPSRRRPRRHAGDGPATAGEPDSVAPAAGTTPQAVSRRPSQSSALRASSGQFAVVGPNFSSAIREWQVR